jgi:hypothetical protein
MPTKIGGANLQPPKDKNKYYKEKDFHIPISKIKIRRPQKSIYIYIK